MRGGRGPGRLAGGLAVDRYACCYSRAARWQRQCASSRSSPHAAVVAAAVVAAQRSACKHEAPAGAAAAGPRCARAAGVTAQQAAPLHRPASQPCTRTYLISSHGFPRQCYCHWSVGRPLALHPRPHAVMRNPPRRHVIVCIADSRIACVARRLGSWYAFGKGGMSHVITRMCRNPCCCAPPLSSKCSLARRAGRLVACTCLAEAFVPYFAHHHVASGKSMCMQMCMCSMMDSIVQGINLLPSLFTQARRWQTRK